VSQDRPIADILAETEQLLDSDRVTEPTRRALRARYHRRPRPPRVLDDRQMRVLAAASRRLIPSELAQVVDLPGAFDARLADGHGDGWRYAELPDAVTLHRCGLNGLNAAGEARFGRPFEDLGDEDQDALLQAACDGRLAMGDGFDAARWFEALLAALVELHYAHPAVQVSIGYDGMADAKGFSAVGLAQVAAEAASGR
jgi:gluconate 2-dehydrogenase gamma chain